MRVARVGWFRRSAWPPAAPRRCGWGGRLRRLGVRARPGLGSGSGGRWEHERRRGWGRGGERARLLEELFELLADLAAAGVAVFPLVGVDAQGCVGFSV